MKEARCTLRLLQGASGLFLLSLTFVKVAHQLAIALKVTVAVNSILVEA
jgi:hypothetical protein